MQLNMWTTSRGRCASKREELKSNKTVYASITAFPWTVRDAIRLNLCFLFVSCDHETSAPFSPSSTAGRGLGLGELLCPVKPFEAGTVIMGSKNKVDLTLTQLVLNVMASGDIDWSVQNENSTSIIITGNPIGVSIWWTLMMTILPVARNVNAWALLTGVV